MLSAISIILNAITIIIFVVILGLVLKERKIQETKRDMVCARITENDAESRISATKEQPMKETIFNYLSKTRDDLMKYFPQENATQA